MSGDLESVVEFRGERYLMVADGIETPRRQVLHRLSAAEWAEEDGWHPLFEEHVGRHWCAHEFSTPDAEVPRDKDKFYNQYAERVPVRMGKAIGWIHLPAE